MTKLGPSPREAALHCLTASGPLTPPTAAGELVKDKCQDLICCQSHTENTAGSTSLVAELVVVYRLFPARSLVRASVCVHMLVCRSLGLIRYVWRGAHGFKCLTEDVSQTLGGC